MNRRVGCASPYLKLNLCVANINQIGIMTIANPKESAYGDRKIGRVEEKRYNDFCQIN